jgi:hypothetical protein
MAKGYRRQKVRQKVSLSQPDIAFLDGLFDPYDNLPDGAWQAACEDAVTTCGRFKGQDPYEVWLAYVAATSERQP